MRRLATGLLAVALLAGCRNPQPGTYRAQQPGGPFELAAPGTPSNTLVAAQAAPSRAYANSNDVARFSARADQAYKLGPGDKFAFLVRGRPDISREDIVVSPDGEIALPRVGILCVQGRTPRETTEAIVARLKAHYDNPEVTLVMQHYNNNKVFVLGRVANPGEVSFPGRGTLLEALSLAGGLPVDTARSSLSRCMIVRGNEMVIWIDLKDLLENGNMALNARLQNNDVLFIPQNDDQLAYVMGQVLQPGVQVLRSAQTVLDAIMSHGGPTRDADVTRVYLARQVGGQGIVEQIDLREITGKGDLRRNFVLREGDIVYVSERGASRINYYLTKLLPSMQVVDFTLRSAESLGAMAELRAKLWGQEGFVSQGYATGGGP